MNLEGFRPEDFLYFLDSDLETRVEYLKDSLHPRLRDFGLEVAGELNTRLSVSLRPQLRSGRWFRHPWATWVTLILAEESVRSDNARPRLCVFLDQHEAIVGFIQCVWKDRWQRLAKRPAGLEKVMDEAARGAPRLELALAHWVEHERRTTVYQRAKELLAAAAEWGQDFVVVGRVYPFPPEADRLTSPEFAAEAAQVLQRAWPVYRYAFEATQGR